MTYVLAASNIVLLGLYVWSRMEASRQLDKATAAHQARENQFYTREDELLNRIQVPEIAVAQSMPDPSPTPLYLPSDDSPYADSAWDELMEASD